MSGGPSRDRDIGRKWESGASKRKRKAETIMSNQAMSSSMMKFLKKHSSGVTLKSEKICDSENKEQIVHIRRSFIELDPGKAHRESLNLSDSGNSGNFIDLFKLLSKYDLTLKEHFHDIQNELITFISKSLIDEIINRVKQAKYYAFMLDCTRDISRVEQMSIILRFCNISTGAIKEYFIDFIAVSETTGDKRWDLIKTKLKLTLKSLSETRWESRIAAVRAIFLQFDDVIECVTDLKNQTDDSETLSDCKAVLNKMLTFEFIVAIHVWYEILLRVNNISKLWQSVQVNLKVAIDTLRSFRDWIQEFCNTGFERSLAEARWFVEKSRHIDEPIQSIEMQYRVNFFNTMIDAIIVDTECRFKALNEYFERFGLFTILII
ncbi:hypothetical protein RN001_008184 [Aquatica leii]|uniref:DUF4371 domain-containing protein n=1 Tax=Aquatica leii TaxID=1421715 RepID=A0AAN7QIV0_9COLE|nr:hypothetical protein RN001_008184 [Aquatica leii]